MDDLKNNRNYVSQSNTETLTKSVTPVLFTSSLLMISLLVYSGERLFGIDEFLTAIGAQLSLLAFFSFIIQGIYTRNIYQMQMIWPFQLYITIITFAMCYWNLRIIEVIIAFIVGAINIYLFFYLRITLGPYNAHFRTYYFKKLGGDEKIQKSYHLLMRVNTITRIYVVFFIIQAIQEYFTILKFIVPGIAKVILVMVFYAIDAQYKNEENKFVNTCCIVIIASEFTLSMGAIIFMPQVYTDDNPEGAIITTFTKTHQLFLLYLKYKSYGSYGTGLKEILKRA